MDYSERYRELLGGHVRTISKLNLPWMVAAGGSASNYSRDARQYATRNRLPFPEIFELDHEQSHSMYLAEYAQDPIVLLQGLVGQLFDVATGKILLVNFLEDYTLMGTKARFMDQRLTELKYTSQYKFVHHVMVARKTRLQSNILVYETDTRMAEWLDGKYNPSKN